MSAAAPPAVFVRGLVKRYDQVVAVDHLDLRAEPGECLGLLGPNGAGKTTTFEIVVGLEQPTAGEVEVLGQRWGRDDHALRARLGVALQETRLPDRLTVIEVLELFRSFYPRGRDLAQVVAEVGLEEKARTWTSKLSGGQRQRLALACALVGDPELLVLDEPTIGLDPEARLRLGDTIRAYRDDGRTVLVSTHYMDEAQRLCDRVAIIDHGRVIALGSPAELIATLGGAEVVELTAANGAVSDEEVRALPGVCALRRTGQTLVVAAAEARPVVAELLELVRRTSATLLHLSTRAATLEDVFVSLTGRHMPDE